MASLAEIRARLQAAEGNKGGQGSQGGGDKSIYPHWNMEEGQSATLRFLPDSNTKNTFFWQERAMIRLPFNGIKGEMDSKQVMVQVPCVEMWGDACPILAEVRTWFKDKSLEDMGRKYWKKRSYIFQGFVRENPIGDDKTPDNPIRRFIIGPQLFTLIKGALMDPELEELPTDAMRGLDFRRWGQYFRPAGVNAPAGGNRGVTEDDIVAASAPVAKAAPAPAPVASASPFDEEDDVPVASAPVAKPAATGQNAQDILAMIRARQNK